MTTASPVAQVIAFRPWDAEGAAASLQRLRESISPGTDVLVLDREPGFAAALNQLASSAPRADLAIVADACALPAGWLERIRRAASGDDALAGATAPASEAGTPIVVPDPVHPRISRLRPQCAYVRRSALELLGPFEESPSAFTLRDGVEVEILEWRKGWVQVRHDSNRNGWVPGNQIVSLKAPGITGRGP